LRFPRLIDFLLFTPYDQLLEHNITIGELIDNDM
jgi:hypothetical protein